MGGYVDIFRSFLVSDVFLFEEYNNKKINIIGQKTMADGNDIQEGFLCPICHKDMRSPSNLLTHFQDLHSDEQEFLKSIKGWF